MKIPKITAAIAILAIIIMAVFVYNLIRPKGPSFETVNVKKGNIIEEVSETGMVKRGDPLNLNFKNAGKIQKIDVKVGQVVPKGQVLAELEKDQLQIQLDQAQASLDLSKIKLNKLLNGASGTDIKAAETKVTVAQTSFINAQRSLSDIEASASEKIKDVYGDAVATLEDSYAKAFNAQNYCDYMQRTYFAPLDSDSIRFFEDCQRIKSNVASIKLSLDLAKKSQANADTDKALVTASSSMENISKALKDAREICEVTQARDRVTLTDKNTLDTHRDYINTSITAVNTAIQTISSQLTTNEYNINVAKTAVDSAQGVLDSAKDTLNDLTAAPRFEDVALMEAEIRQSKAQAKLLQIQLNDSTLFSPIDGQIIGINKEVGEMVQPIQSEGVIVMLPADPYQIEVDIYEEDVVKIKKDNPVNISFVAIPDKTFAGEVLSIDPFQKLINSVVYYQITIGISEAPASLKPGMSADVVIKTAEKKNVLIIPEGALQKKDGAYLVQILINDQFEDRIVQTGLRSKGEVEIISGIKEGDVAIIPQ